MENINAEKVLKLSSWEATSTIEEPTQQMSLFSLSSSQESEKSDKNTIAKI